MVGEGMGSRDYGASAQERRNRGAGLGVVVVRRAGAVRGGREVGEGDIGSCGGRKKVADKGQYEISMWQRVSGKSQTKYD